MTNKYDKMTDEDFDRILSDIAMEEGAALVDIPGVYEIVREHFNNEVLDRWEAEQDEGHDEDNPDQTEGSLSPDR